VKPQRPSQSAISIIVLAAHGTALPRACRKTAKRGTTEPTRKLITPIDTSVTIAG
jgi:hypothetical protein